MVETLISGGQTGADRAALDVAIRHGLPHGGWCPRGRKAEDGPINGRYALTETPGADYVQRTEWNVRDSDATVVFTLGAEVTGGSLSTIELARRYGRPCIHLSRVEEPHAALRLRDFLDRRNASRLNVAGSRESKEPGIHAWVTSVLEEAFFPPAAARRPTGAAIP